MIHNVLREVHEHEKAPVEPFSAHGRLAASSRLRTRRAQSHNDLAACFSTRAWTVSENPTKHVREVVEAIYQTESRQVLAT